jgi:sugar lactone lactonase YvrE
VSGENRCWPLPGRPGFAFPTEQPGLFLVGIERRVYLFDRTTGECRPVSDEVDVGVEGTIINDAVPFAGGIVLGTKDLAFAEKKAGLYLWRINDQSLVQLRDDQVCSNGKVIWPDGDSWRLLDIDTPTQTVVEYQLDVEQGTLSEERVVLDLTELEIFPDGMVATEDHRSVIIAFYNPGDAPYGVVRQYRLETGALECEWQLAGSPQVTCPLLIELKDEVRLLATTAAENMSAERLARYPQAGCLYTASTGLKRAGSEYRFPVDQLQGVG